MANPVDLAGNELPPHIEPGRSTISFWVEAHGPSGTLIDAVGCPAVPLRGDVLAPALTACTRAGLVPATSMRGTQLTVTMDTATVGSDPGLLLMHHLNALSRKAQMVSVTR